MVWTGHHKTVDLKLQKDSQTRCTVVMRVISQGCGGSSKADIPTAGRVHQSRRARHQRCFARVCLKIDFSRSAPSPSSLRNSPGKNYRAPVHD